MVFNIFAYKVFWFEKCFVNVNYKISQYPCKSTCNIWYALKLKSFESNLELIVVIRLLFLIKIGLLKLQLLRNNYDE